MKKLLMGFLCLGFVVSARAGDGRYEIAQFMVPYTITNSGSRAMRWPVVRPGRYRPRRLIKLCAAIRAANKTYR